MIYVWLVAFIVLVIFELATVSLTSIWFALGAAAALVCNLLGLNETIQIVVFVIVSILLLLLTKPLADKYFKGRTIKTNVESYIGQTAKVIERINNLDSAGTVMFNGLEWRAVSKEGRIIEVGEYVTITSVEGVKLIVK